MKAGLIAAGLGERLQAAGLATPKPLVRVAGRALVDHVLDALAEAGIAEVACLFNAEPATDAVEAHCRGRGRAPRLEIRRKTTPSSIESLREVADILSSPHPDPLPGGEGTLILTVDAVFAPETLRAFVAAAARWPDADAVLAVTDHIDDEKPLHATLDERGRITALGTGAAASGWITAGFYVFAPRALAAIAAARPGQFAALRAFLAHLVDGGSLVYGVPMGKTLDVDRPEDIAAAEAFVRRGYR
jgi:NDP-sugar pyrophosphorylase family protein